MTKPIDPTLPLELSLEPDEYCALCGADESTSERLVDSFLNVPVITPEHGPCLRRICNSCLSMVLSVAFQLLGRTGGRVAEAAIMAQDGLEDDPR